LAEPTTSSLLATQAGDPGTVWLITGGRRYPIAAAAVDGVAMVLGLGSSAAVEAPAAWLNLFAPGSELAGFQIPHAGEAAIHQAEVEGREVRIGSVVRIAAGERTRAYVVTENSELAQLTTTAAALYEYGLTPEQQALAPVTAQGTQLQAFTFSSELKYPPDWPEQIDEPLESGAIACALTTGEPDVASAARLAVAKEPVEPGTRVEKGRGALIVPSDSATGTASYPFLVDHSGTAYAIPRDPDTVLAQLGYSPENATYAPRAWIALFAAGPALDPEAAGLAVSAAETGQIPAATADPAQAGGTGADRAGPDADGSACSDRVNNLSPLRPSALDAIQLVGVDALATGQGIRVAVVDSGVAPNRHFEDPEGLKNTVEDGWDFRYNGGTPPDPEVDTPPEGQVDAANGKVDLDGHGTVVAGLIAARPLEGSGLRGAAPGATIIPIRVYVSSSEEATAIGHGPTEDNLAAGILAAVAADAAIINISMSTDEDHPGIRAAVEAAQAAGALIVASAGNPSDVVGQASPPWYGPDGSVYQVRYPAAYPGVLGVAATGTDGLAGTGSLHGPQVDIAAPGAGIVSTYLNGGDCGVNGDEPSSSFATGFVSGAAALVAERYPRAGPDYWAYRLTATAVRTRSDSSDQIVGWGALQVHDALTATLDATVPGPTPPGDPNQAAEEPEPTASPVPLIAPRRQASALEPVRAITAPALITLTALVAAAATLSARPRRQRGRKARRR
jgi:hypothetical protein